MPSPFPGMDPYLEAFGPWRDFHHTFIVYARDALQPLLRPKYRACVEERVLLGPDEPGVYPDVSVVREPTETYPAAPVATEDYDPPVVVRTQAPMDEPHQVLLRITLPGPEAKVVTVIELLSPSNKARGHARWSYESKQQQILSSDVNLVEVDLLLGGTHVAAVPLEELEHTDAPDYLVSVSRATDRTRFELYPGCLSRRLPRVAVPLLPEDKDVVLNLQTVFNQAYDNGGYADTLDYAQPFPLPNREEQRDRIDVLLKRKDAAVHE